MTIEFEKLDPTDIRKVMKTSEKYRYIFGGKPWKEVSRGSGCRELYGPQNPPGSICPCGCGKLEEAYPIIETTRYIRDEIKKPNAIAIIAKENGEIVAFGWGYEETGKSFAESKYNEVNSDFVSNIVGKEKKVFYMSECGVVPEKQNLKDMKVGSRITLEIADMAVQQGNSLLLRTMKSTEDNPSRMDGIAKNKLGMKPIMGSEDTPPDPENPERILYYKE